tara:strand:+ start:12381 stop:13268 length:888 start_codon:yes stop_codon:yes gene_type:complete
MRDYDDELMDYEDDAEDRYDDYDYEDEYYDDEDEFDTGLEGNEDSYYDDDYIEEEVEYLPAGEYEDQFDSYKTTSIGRIDPNDRTFTVVVKNTSGADAEAIIFGGNEEAAQPAGVTVTVEESSHKEVREESKANPFKIAGMKMSVSDPLQFDNVLKVTKRTAAGSNTVRVYQPRNATSPQNFTQQLIDDNNFEMDVTGQDSLRFLIKDGVTVVFTFTMKARANMGNLLKGQNVAELSQAPRTTGLPQLDLLRTKKPTAFGLKPKRKVKKVVRRRPVKKTARRRPRRGGFMRRRRR